VTNEEQKMKSKAKNATKKKGSLEDSIIAGLREAIAHTKGEEAPGLVVRTPVDVKAIRERTGLSQSGFAEKFGIPAPTLRAWEQGQRAPERAAALYLHVIDKERQAVERALKVA
jgi:putative transcriptional regulator